jgi:RNA polymerase sigma factor (sigma-70 family)
MTTIEKNIEVLAERLVTGMPFHVTRDDLIQEGWYGAIKALNSYDGSQTATRRTWMYTWARGHMMHYLRHEARLRGIAGQKWEARTGVIKEVFMEDLPPGVVKGRDGLADRVAEKVDTEAFIASIPNQKAKALCRAIAGGEDNFYQAARSVGMDTGAIYSQKEGIARVMRYRNNSHLMPRRPKK